MDTNKYLEWFDDYGLVHLNPNPTPTDSENGVLFTAAFCLFHPDKEYGKKVAEKALDSVVTEKYEYFRPSGENDNSNSHFSYDNMIGVYVLHKLAGRSLKKLPVMKWNERIWGHPRDILFFSYVKTGFLPFYLLALPFFLWTIMTGPLEETSTDLLLLYRLKGFDCKLTLFLFTLIRKVRFGSEWLEAVRYYFKHPDHPVPALVADWEKE